MILNALKADLISAMKQHDSAKTQTIRYILSQIKNFQINSQTEPTNEDIVSLIRKEVKRLQEANVSFKQASRTDLVLENDSQIEILQNYLPTELSDADLELKIKALISENSDIFNKNKNAFIGFAVSKLKSEAESQRIASKVKQVIETSL